MDTNRPRKLASAIETKAGECGHNFRRIIKMIKHWNIAHSEYLTSYHIEVLALSIFSQNVDDTPWNVFQFFDQARPLLASSLWYELDMLMITCPQAIAPKPSSASTTPS